MGDYSILPSVGTLNIAVSGDYSPAQAIELGLVIVRSGQEQAIRNGTPRMTFEGPRGAGTPKA